MSQHYTFFPFKELLFLVAAAVWLAGRATWNHDLAATLGNRFEAIMPAVIDLLQHAATDNACRVVKSAKNLILEFEKIVKLLDEVQRGQPL